MQDLLYKGSKEGAALVNAVTIRSSDAAINNIRKSLKQFYYREQAFIAELELLEDRGITDNGSASPSDLSNNRMSNSYLLQTKSLNNKKITL
jgi:hypothetical protein